MIIIKGIFKAIGYFILYFILTMLFQTLLSIIFMAVAAVNGLRDENLIVEFANNNILVITIFFRNTNYSNILYCF